MLTEYIPSIDFEEIPKEDTESIFDIMQLEGRERLIDVGRTMATDTFINFHRRFPLLWDIPRRRGLENVLFRQADGEVREVFVVNSCCNCFRLEIDQHAAMLEYLGRMEKFLNCLFVDCKAVMKGETDINGYAFNSLKTVKEFLHKKIEIKGILCLEIMFGIIVGYYNILQMGMERVRKMLNRAKKLAILENRQNWEKQIEESVSLVYLKEAYELINHYLQLNVEELAWVLKLSKNFKAVDEFDSENEEEDDNYIDIDKKFILKSHESYEHEPEQNLVEEYVEADKEDSAESVQERSIEEIQVVPVVKKSSCCIAF